MKCSFPLALLHVIAYVGIASSCDMTWLINRQKVSVSLASLHPMHPVYPGYPVYPVYLVHPMYPACPV